MMKIQNDIYTGAQNRKSLIDLEIPEDFNGEIIIFIHGFMGFKDWGAWHLVMDYFVQKGYGFCKFNISHGGGTSENGIDFPDPDSFGNNTFSHELEDLNQVVRWIDEKVSHWKGHLIGHSKGGAIALIGGEQIEKIHSVSTWAAIASIGERFPTGEQFSKWKSKGVKYVKNGRTMQELPQKYTLYIDYMTNENAFDLERICSTIDKPIFVAHGEKDTSVDINNGRRLAKWSKTNLSMIKHTDHVFDSRHPWISSELPSPLLQLCEKTLEFLNNLK
jgi:pimeloyl-ACP methyl ester carboxylesterase